MFFIFKKSSQSGMAIINVLAGIVIIGVITFSVTSRHIANLNMIKHQKVHLSAGKVREKILSHIKAPLSWKNTEQSNQTTFFNVQNSPDGKASADTNNLLSLFGENGEEFYNSREEAQGFTMDGEICNGFDMNEGNLDCPMRYEVRLKIRRATTNGFMDVIGLSLLYNAGSDGPPFNPRSMTYTFDYFRNVSREEALKLSCESMSGSFDAVSSSCTSHLTQSSECKDGEIYRGPEMGSDKGSCAEVKMSSTVCLQGKAVIGFDDKGPICGEVGQ